MSGQAAKTNGEDRSEALVEQVQAARASARSLRIRGTGSREVWVAAASGDGEGLDVSAHRGIISFEPSELVLTARAGTSLLEIEAVLAEQGQQLPFDPPRFGAGGTLGGAVASGLAGPARPWRGAVRDAVLGITLLDGHGAVGRYGGQVMKNVAGYDVARLNAGGLGSLGVLLDISLRLQPRPEMEATCLLELGLGQVFERMAELGRRPLPLTGMTWEEGCLRLRLSGSEAAVTAALRSVGAETCADGDAYWAALRDRSSAFFTGEGPLWRLSLPPTAPQPSLGANWLLDWAGAQRWCVTDAPAQQVFAAAAAAGGHAMRLTPAVARPQPPGAMLALQQRIKAVFDPQALFNPGVFHPGLL